MGSKTTLHLTLFAEFFYQILKGNKSREFRQKTKYWQARLINGDGTPRHFEKIIFKNGYATDAPLMIVECKGIEVTDVFEIVLGKVLSSENLERLKAPVLRKRNKTREKLPYKVGDFLFDYNLLDKEFDL